MTADDQADRAALSSPAESTDSLAGGADGAGYARDAQQHDNAHDGAHAHGEHEHHGPSTFLLIVIFAALLLLTWATVGVTVWDFGYQMNLVVAMAIAFVKAALVGIWFMHLRWDPPIFGFTLIASLGFVTLFIIFTLLDTGEYMPNIEQENQAEASSATS